VAFGQKKNDQQTLVELCNKLRKTRDTMTVLIGSFKEEDPDFHAVYMTAQKEDVKPKKKVEETKTDATKTIVKADKKETKKGKSAKAKSKSKKKGKKSASDAGEVADSTAETTDKIEGSAEQLPKEGTPQ
jgi:hypothetical protein